MFKYMLCAGKTYFVMQIFSFIFVEFYTLVLCLPSSLMSLLFLLSICQKKKRQKTSTKWNSATVFLLAIKIVSLKCKKGWFFCCCSFMIDYLKKNSSTKYSARQLQLHCFLLDKLKKKGKKKRKENSRFNWDNIF